MNTPTAMDVVAFLNARFAERGLSYRVENVEVLPYVNPMWMANWDVPQLAGAWDEIEEDVREARWQYPQVLP